MHLLKNNDLIEINGGFHMNIGTAIAAMAIGLITGGPVGYCS